MQLVTRWLAAATISTNSCMILGRLGWAGRSVSSVSSINMLHGPSAQCSTLRSVCADVRPAASASNEGPHESFQLQRRPLRDGQVG